MFHYTEIPAKSLTQIEDGSPCDIYLRRGSHKFTRVFHKDYVIDQPRLQSYLNRGVESLWIKEGQQKKYMGSLEKRLNQLKDQRKIKSADFLELTENLCTYSLNHMHEIRRIEPETYKVARSAVDGLVQLVQGEKILLAKILNRARAHRPFLRHSVSTTVFSLLLASADDMKMGRKLLLVGLAGLLHDLGHCFFETDIEEANPDLTKTEKLHLLHHPKRIRNMDGDFSLEQEVRVAIEQHHEKWNGQGYPQRLRGEHIYYPARILQIADRFSQLTMGWKGQQPLSPRMALFSMKQEKAYDPRLLEVFTGLFRGK